MITRKYFLFFVFFLFLPIVYAQVEFTCSDIIFNDTFDYTGNLGQPNGFWTGSSATGGCGGADDTQFSVFTTRAYGINSTGYCNSVSSSSASLTFPANYTTGTYIFSYNFSSLLHPLSAIDGIYMGIGEATGKDIYIEANFNAQDTISTRGVGLGGFQNCELTRKYPIPNTGEMIFEINLDTKLYTLYWNGDSAGCRNYRFVNDSFDFKLGYVAVYGEFPDTASGQRHQMYIDDVLVCEGNTTAEDCPFPQLFCDTFDYTNSLYNEKDWIVYNQNSEFGNDFSPLDARVWWNETNPRTIGHEIERFPVSYQINDVETTVESLFAPVFSNEFDFNVLNGTLEHIHFRAFDYEYDLCWDIEFNLFQNLSNNFTKYSINVLNVSTSQYDQLSSWQSNITRNFKVISRFTHINKSFPFNTSNSRNTIDIYQDDNPIARSVDFYANCDNIFFPNIEKQNGTLEIDNYYMYVGTDKTFSTLDIDVVPLYEETEIDQNITSPTTGTTDFAEAVDSIWEDFGLITTLSKIMFGLMLMVIFAIFIIAVFISRKMVPNLGVVAFLEIMFMVFLTYLGLLPVWILITLGLISAGIGVVFLKAQIT